MSSTQDLLTKPSNLSQLIVDMSLCPHRPAVPTGSWPWCKTCPIHHPANSFTSSCTNLTYPITTHADCKSMNLIYQLQCTECNAFYIGETRRSLSDHMNGHHFTTTVLNPDLPVAVDAQSHQISFQECWPDTTPDHIHHQFEAAYQSHPSNTSHPRTQHPLTILYSTLALAALTISCQAFLFYYWRRSQCWLKASPPFKYHPSADPTTWTSCLGKCCSVSPNIFIIISLSRFSLLCYILKGENKYIWDSNIDLTYYDHSSAKLSTDTY